MCIKSVKNMQFKDYNIKRTHKNVKKLINRCRSRVASDWHACRISCQSDVIYYSIQTYFLYIIIDYKNLKFKHYINDIAIDLWCSEDFANIEDIKRKCNLMVDLSKFIFNKKILSGVVTKFCRIWLVL